MPASHVGALLLLSQWSAPFLIAIEFCDEGSPDVIQTRIEGCLKQLRLHIGFRKNHQLQSLVAVHADRGSYLIRMCIDRPFDVPARRFKQLIELSIASFRWRAARKFRIEKPRVVIAELSEDRLAEYLRTIEQVGPDPMNSKLGGHRSKRRRIHHDPQRRHWHQMSIEQLNWRAKAYKKWEVLP